MPSVAEDSGQAEWTQGELDKFILTMLSILQERDKLAPIKSRRVAMDKKDINRSIKAEIKWCDENMGTLNPVYKKGFIKGLRQAMYILKKISYLEGKE